LGGCHSQKISKWENSAEDSGRYNDMHITGVASQKVAIEKWEVA
jgi:hypothetical protein